MAKGSTVAKRAGRNWSMTSSVAALAAATAAKTALGMSWRAATGKKPPANPAHPDVSVGEALAWATLSGTTIAVARILAIRGIADYYRRSTGHLPAGLERDDA